MKKLFKWLGFTFKKLTGKAKKAIQDHIEPAIKVVNLLKDAVENPALNLIVQLTPFNWDDAVFKEAKVILPKALLELEILKDATGKSNPEMIKQIVDEIRKYATSDRAKFYEDLSSKLAVMLSDGKLTIDEAAELVRLVYAEKYKSK